MTDWSHRNIIPTLLLTTGILVSVKVYSTYLRRIPEAAYIQPGLFRKRSLFGTVTRVGDADNFHFYHTPGGRLTGWGWFPGRKVPTKKADLKGNTVRIAIVSCLFASINSYQHHRYTFELLELTRPKLHISVNLRSHLRERLSLGSRITFCTGG